MHLYIITRRLTLTKELVNLQLSFRRHLIQLFNVFLPFLCIRSLDRIARAHTIIQQQASILTWTFAPDHFVFNLFIQNQQITITNKMKFISFLYFYNMQNELPCHKREPHFVLGHHPHSARVLIGIWSYSNYYSIQTTWFHCTTAYYTILDWSWYPLISSAQQQ